MSWYYSTTAVHSPTHSPTHPPGGSMHEPRFRPNQRKACLLFPVCFAFPRASKCPAAARYPQPFSYFLVDDACLFPAPLNFRRENCYQNKMEQQAEQQVSSMSKRNVSLRVPRVLRGGQAPASVVSPLSFPSACACSQPPQIFP